MSAQLEWGVLELAKRRAEDARFPAPPTRDDPRWYAFAQMKFRRALRRKRQGYSRATAESLVKWAEQQEAAR